MTNPMTSIDIDSPLLTRRMSFDEWAALPEDEPGELVDGFLVEEEVPGFAHELVVIQLAHLLVGWGSSRGALVGAPEQSFASHRAEDACPT